MFNSGIKFPNQIIEKKKHKQKQHQLKIYMVIVFYKSLICYFVNSSVFIFIEKIKTKNKNKQVNEEKKNKGN